MQDAIQLDTIRAALALTNFDVVRAQSVMTPMKRPIDRPTEKEGDARQAGVLLLLYPIEDALHMVLIRRNSYEGVHSDQVGLPGGRLEQNESYIAAALRETNEELGINPSDVQIIGQLTPIYIPPSDFYVQPTVGYISHHPVWQPDPREVAEVIEVSVQTLLDEALKRSDSISVQGFQIKAPYYDLLGHKCWGATAMMLAEFEGRIKAVLDID